MNGLIQIYESARIADFDGLVNGFEIKMRNLYYAPSNSFKKFVRVAKKNGFVLEIDHERNGHICFRVIDGDRDRFNSAIRVSLGLPL